MKNEYRVVMLGVNDFDNIIIKTGLTLEQAVNIKQKYEQNDNLHYFEIEKI